MPFDINANPWKIVSQETIYDNPWINVTQYNVLNPAQKPGIYGKVHYKNVAIGIIPIDERGYTYLVGQYRFPLNAYSWEIPEGGSPHHEDPLEGARRELLEETGLIADEWTLIQAMHLSNSVSDEYALIYVARQLRQSVAAPEETEQLNIKHIPFEEAYQMVEQGVITDSMSVAGILKLKIMLSDGRIS